jgi:hypothetical protein
MGIEGRVGLAQQPALPVRIFFTELGFAAVHPFLPLHLAVRTHLVGAAGVIGMEAPALFIHRPLLLDVDDGPDTAGADNVPHRERIRLAAVLRSHLNHLLRRLHHVARLPGLGKYVGERLLDVAVFSRPDHVDAKLGMLEVAGGDHHAVDIVARQHFLRVLVGLRLDPEDLFHLSSALFPRQAPDVAYGNGFDRHFLCRPLRHVDVALAAEPAS